MLQLRVAEQVAHGGHNIPEQDVNRRFPQGLSDLFREYSKDSWVGNRFKEREVARAVREEAAGYNINVDTLLELVKHQREYQ